MESLRPKIVNIVTSSWIGKIDILALAGRLPRCIYEPGTFSGMVYRRKVPDCTIIMFGSGRLVSTGVKSIQQVKPSIYTTAIEIEKITKRRQLVKKLKIENIVAVQDLGRKFELGKICDNLSNCTYKPESFAGMVYRNYNNRCVLVFASGKVVFMGAKSVSELNEISSEIHEKLNKF